jgi:hypothetical protein
LCLLYVFVSELDEHSLYSAIPHYTTLYHTTLDYTTPHNTALHHALPHTTLHHTTAKRKYYDGE